MANLGDVVTAAPELDPSGPTPARRVLSTARAVGNRLFWLLVVAWAAVTVTFVLARVVPADPARLAAGLQAGPEQVEALRAQMGLDRPILVQYLDYLWSVVRLDFGDSLKSRQPVLNELAYVLPETLQLVLVSFLAYAVVGVALGVLWTVFPRGPLSGLIRLVSFAGAALPVFWLGMVLQAYFGSTLKILPISGTGMSDFDVPRVTGFSLVDSLLAGNFAAFGSAAQHLVLPALTLLLSQLALATRLTRVSLDKELKKPYVRVVQARGVGGFGVVVVNALRNALNPVVTMLGLQFGWLLGGTIIVEVLFSWPGLGLYAFNAFSSFDYNAILAVTLVVTVAFVLVNELVTFVYPLLDPRLRGAR